MRRALIAGALLLPVLVLVGVAWAAGGLAGAKSSTAGFQTLKQARRPPATRSRCAT